MSEKNENKAKPNPSTQMISKGSMTRTKAGLWVGCALLVGFIGGIWFGDNAQKRVSLSTTDVPVSMEISGEVMQRGMAPGPAKIDTQQAIQKMEQILVSDPKNLELLIHLGNLYFDTNNPQKAVDNYEKALALDRKNPDVLTDCGTMYRQLKKYDKALVYFKEATQLAPSHFQSWYNLGILYRDDLKQYQNAINAWNKILVNIPQSEHIIQVKEEIDKTKNLLY